MRLCTNCNQITTGKPLFCNKCGNSYNIKLCSRLHVNPRAAQICAECGSKDLSTPQPKASLFVRFFIFLLGLGPVFLFFAAAGIYLAFYIHKLFTNPNGLLPLMCLGFLLGLLLLVWMMLPKGLRRLLAGIGKLVFRRKSKDGSNKH
ncbi:MAG TPA: zinc ribbon domain-containing protein [Candidatus Angelobacter sp.]|nr:zinc ribbon domain-containing protein [Candidatus Angelobacter sp.]